MCTILWTTLGLILSAIGSIRADTCHTICSDIQKTVNFKSACAPFRNVIPKPKVARHCQSGFTAAVEKNCYDTCTNVGVIKPYLCDLGKDQVCSSSVKAVPRPACHDACVGGYQAGVETMALELIKRMDEIPRGFATVLEETSPALVPSQIPTADEATIQSEIEEPVMGTDAEQMSKVLAIDIMDGLSNIVDKEHREHTQTPQTLVMEELDKTPQNDEQPLPLLGDEKEGGEVHEEVKAISQGALLFSVPITIDDEEFNMDFFLGESPADVVMAFCEEHMPNEVTECMQELWLVVQDKIHEHAPIE